MRSCSITFICIYLGILVSNAFSNSDMMFVSFYNNTAWVSCRAELHSLPEHPSSSLVRVAQSLVLYLVNNYLFFRLFTFGYCIVCRFSMYDF